MKLAITGCNGSVGKRVVALSLRKGYTVVGIDISPRPDAESSLEHFSFHQVDLTDYNETVKVLQGCEGIVQLAAIPNPSDYDVHNRNVVISWNVLRAAAKLRITRIAQASSVNVITLVFSQQPHFDYFPIDEVHPCLPDEPYGLSKLICEQQADTIVRRYPSMRIASIRLAWSIPNRSMAQGLDVSQVKNALWGWVQEDSAADAFLLAVTGDDKRWSGHERFFIVAPNNVFEEDAEALRKQYWQEVPIKEGKEFRGKTGFFDCEKATRLLGWAHEDLA